MTTFWKRGLVAWGAMTVTMTANGIVREAVIAPRTNRRAADVISAASGIVILQLIARRALSRTGAPSRESVRQLAAAWLFMTLAFECGIGRAVDKKSWSDLLENYNVLEGRLWPIVLATLVAAPSVWTPRTRRIAATRSRASS